MSQPPLEYQSPRTDAPTSRAGHTLTGGAIGIGVTLPALFFAIWSAGAGHGDYVLARLLFPYTCFFAFALPRMDNVVARTFYVLLYGTDSTGGITLPLMILAFLQFPAYGALFGYFATRGARRLAFVVVIIVVLQVLVTIPCFFTGL